MLEDRIREWKAQYRREGLAAGRREGLEQGREKGLEQGLKQGLEQGLEKGLEQGIEKGIAQGLEQGSLREARTILRRQLTRRFGSVPASVEDRMTCASREQLEQWIDQLYVAASIDEVFLSPKTK